MKQKSILETVNGYRRRLTGRHKGGIWVISAQSLLTATGFSLVIPFLSLYLYQDRGLPMTTVGSIMMVAGFCSAGAHIVGGELSDRFGRRPVVIIPLAVRVVVYAAMALLIAASAPVWAIATSYIVGQAIGMMGRPASSAIVADLSPRKRLTEAFSLFRVGMNLGWAAGPAIGGYLATFMPYSWLFGVSALLTAMALLIVFFWLKESNIRAKEKMGPRNLSHIFKDKTFLAYTTVSLVVFLLMGQMMSTLSIFTVDFMGLSTAQYGMLLTTNGLMVVFLQYPVSFKLGSMSKPKVLIAGSLLFTLGYFTFGWADGFALAVLAMVVVTMGEIIYAPAALAVIGELAPPRYSGRYMGVFGLTQIMGISMGPLLGGILLDALPTSPLLLWGIISMLGVVAAFGYYLWSVKYKLPDTAAD